MDGARELEEPCPVGACSSSSGVQTILRALILREIVERLKICKTFHSKNHLTCKKRGKEIGRCMWKGWNLLFERGEKCVY